MEQSLELLNYETLGGFQSQYRDQNFYEIIVEKILRKISTRKKKSISNLLSLKPS